MRYKNQGIAHIKDPEYMFFLRNAIIVSAAKELRNMYRAMRRAGKKADEAIEKNNYASFRRYYSLWWRYDPEPLERFFRSDYYHSLTSVDGEYILTKIKEEEL